MRNAVGRHEGGNVRNRPIGVWILTILAGFQFVLAIGHFLQALGILPYVVGGNDYGDHTWFYVIVWALLIWAWGWVTWALYSLNPQGWLVVLLVSGFAAVFNFINMAAATQATPDLTLTFLADVVIFAYALLPSTQKAFGLKDKLPPLNP
jgi:pimeloyl-ACP methyl ester carboxylesterase